MRITLFTGIKEELDCALSLAQFDFDPDIRAYRCKAQPNFFCATTGPGISRRGEIRKILEQTKPDLIINAGLTGILDQNDNIKPGERLKLGRIIRARDQVEYPGGPGGHDCLVTVEKAVFEPAEKLDLKMRYKARACDMEAAELLALAGQMRGLSERCAVAFCKVAGDLPADHALFKHEYLLRSWPSRPWYDRLVTSVGFPGGIGRFRRLQKLKLRALAGLRSEISFLLEKAFNLGDSGDPLVALRGSNYIDSVFVPH